MKLLSKKLSKKLLIVAVGGIVLVALGGGALYFKQKVTK